MSLVETVVALSIMVVVIGAGSTLLVRSLDVSALQRQRDSANALVDQALERARAVSPARLADGRTAAAVAEQLAVSPTAADWSQGDPRGLAGPAVPAVLPLSESPQVAGTSYLMRSFVSRCFRPAGPDATCSATASAGSVPLLRVSVVVGWQGALGQGCPLTGNRCEVIASTLIDPNGVDPVFREGS